MTTQTCEPDRIKAKGSEELVELVPDLQAEEMDERLRRADRRTEVGHRELAFYLAEMQERGLHQMLGYSSAIEYACKRLEMGRRHAQELIVVGRALNELRLVDEAFCAALIRWSRVRLLVRIAVPETERAWLERCLELSWNEFDREVATSERGRPPRKDRRGLPRVRIVVRGRLERVAYETWEVAKTKIEDELGERMTDADFMSYAASLVLGTTRNGASTSRERIDDSIYRIVVQKCPDCERHLVRTAEGLEEIDPTTAACIECDAPSQTPEDDPDHESKTPPALRRKVLIRDGLACRACRRREQLMAHHIIWASNGGPTKASNLITLCYRCHGLVHENLLFVRGKAPNGVTFTDRHGVPLDAAAPLVGTAIARIRMDAPAPALGATIATVGPVAPEATTIGSSAVVRLASLASQVSHEWWRLHRRLFTWSEATGEMRFREGEPERVTPAGADAAPQTDASPESTEAAVPHRPARLADVVGQEAAVRTLTVASKAARKRNRAVDHVLLLGAAGLGKTTLAAALAAEVGTHGRCANGAAIRDPGVLIRLLTSLEDRDVLFIDEVHALPRRVLECLYEAMEDGRISLTATDGHESRAIQIALPAFTLVGATTEIGRLPDPFVSRFPIRQYLLPYGDAEISTILTRAAAREAVPIEPDAAAAIAAVARGGARQALGLLRRVRDEVLAENGIGIDRDAVGRALAAAGIGEDGLGALERAALGVLAAHGRPMGIARWSAAAGLAPAVIRQACEPELMRRGLVWITPHGRMARPAPAASAPAPAAAARAQLRAIEPGGYRYGVVSESPGVDGALCRDRMAG